MLKELNRNTASAQAQPPVKVLQFGKGNFLRAFADWMIEILNRETDFNGAVQIVQVNSTETDMRFARQEGLYHVVINGIRGGVPVREVSLIRSVAGVINPLQDYEAFLRAGENPDLKFIISNTTEAGIAFEGTDQSVETPATSFPGKLTALLYHRFKFFSGDPSKGLIILPCELIEKNGEVLRSTVLQYVDHWSLGEPFKAWINNQTLFCNTLVDRIVPGFPKDDASQLWNEIGFKDELLVSAEPYHLWVIEPISTPGSSIDRLRIAIPLDRCGLNVKFVSGLERYRTTKVRILNGAHTCLVPVAYLRGLRTVKEAVGDAFTGDFIRETIREEIIPTLDFPTDELLQFASDVMDRFQNPYIRHELRAIALNSISKFQVRVLPSILEYTRRNNEVPQRLCYAFACLLAFYRGEWRGESLPVNDTPEVMNFFATAWKEPNPGSVTRTVLANVDLWNTDLTTVPGLAAAVEDHLRNLIR